MAILKLFVLLAAVSLLAVAVPLKSKNQSSNEVYKKLMARKLFSVSRIQLESSTHSAEKFDRFEDLTNLNDQKLNAINFRLPNNTIPLHYRIQITSNIQQRSLLFSGNSLITIRFLETSDTITLHSSQLILQLVHVFNTKMDFITSNVDFRTDSRTDFLEIHLNQEFAAGEEIILELSYLGLMRTDRRAFYRTKHFSSNEWVAATLFEPTFARQAFPCYDEIRYRTTFDISIEHDPIYHALSNMPVKEMRWSNGNTMTVFERTPPMPVYNVAFVISNFDFTSNNNENLPMRVYARSSEITAGRANESLELGEKMWSALEGVFGIPYPLPKTDMVAVDNWSNVDAWGLIKIWDLHLLHLGDRMQKARQIAHEYSHTYFGNLVSPSDWSYLWLNEGFATLYENIIRDIVFPETENWEDFLLNLYDAVVDADAFGVLNSLNHYAETPFDIQMKFDFTTYMKGAVVLRMLKDAITEDIFVKGVRFYLEKMSFKSATPSDLFDGIQRAYDEAHPGNKINFNDVMDTWVNFSGLPIVRVSRSANGLLLTQESTGFNGDKLFSIPISYATASDKNFDNATAEFWMTTKEHEITRESAGKTWTEDDWIIFNIRDTGYYITNYDEILWNLIINSLANDHEEISFFNRATLYADTFRLIELGSDFRATIFLELIDSLKLEFHPHVWQRADFGLHIFERRLRGSQVHVMLLNFMRDLMGKIYGRTFNTTRFASDRAATNIINKYSCIAGVQSCVDDATNALMEFMETERTEFEFSYRCNAFRVANESIWMHFYEDAMRQEGFDRTIRLFDLECTQNPDLIQIVLDTAIDFTNTLSTFDRSDLIANMASENEVGYDVVIDFVEKNYQVINRRITSSTLVIVILQLSFNTNTERNAERVLDLVDLIDPFFQGTFDRAYFRSFMDPNLRFLSRNVEDIREWFENYENHY